MSLEVANALKTPDYFVVSQNSKDKICSLSLLSSYITSQIVIPTSTGLQYVSVDNITITGDGTPGNPLVAIAGGAGTVTSVGMSVPTGLTVTGSPVTTAGTLVVSLTAGYVIPTTTQETNWNTAYTNRITLLTTTGTSGAATLIANTLNIPQYTAGSASPLTTKGDLYTFSTVDARLAVGATNGMFLQVASGATTGNQWSPYTLPVAIPTVGKILRSDGTNMLGTTATYPTTVTSGRLIMASASDVVSDVAMSGDATITNGGVITVTSLANLKKGSFGATWNGQGGVVTNSNTAIVEVTIPYAGTITDWNVESYYTVAGVPTALAGTIVFDIYRSGASIIGAGNKPTLTAASTASAAVAGWTSTAVAAGDKLFIYIVGTPVTSLVVSVTIKITKS